MGYLIHTALISTPGVVELSGASLRQPRPSRRRSMNVPSGCNLGVRGPVGVVWGRFGTGLEAPNRAQIDPKRPRPDLEQPQVAAT